MAKLTDKLFNRVIEGELEFGEDEKSKIEEMIKKGNEFLKGGSYIYDGNINSFIHVDEVPADYEGIVITFEADGLYVEHYDGAGNSIFTYISPWGVDKVDPQALVSLTHSFAELDETLRDIVQDAIDDNYTDGVACTEAQWTAIKPLLDKSLYLHYGDYNLIKSVSDGIGNYLFGTISSADQNQGRTLYIQYDISTNTLFAKYVEN